MEPQEGDIAADGKGGFFVYRGGLWFASNEKGYPLERMPRPDYGDRYYQQPNGDIVREGPRGGFEVVERAEGGASNLVGAEQRGRYNIGAGPLVAAERNLAVEEARGNPLNRDWGAAVLNGIDLDPRGDSSFRPFAPLANIWGGQDWQNAQQALSTYEASLMPIQSGASVTASEAARQIRADFPALGDSPETLRRKAANRMMRINAIQEGLGREPVFSQEEINNPDLRVFDAESELVGPINPETGLPTYPRIQRSAAGIEEIPIPEGGYGPPDAPTGPGSSQDNPVDITDPEAVQTLRKGSWLRLADGTVYQLPEDPYVGAPREGAVRQADGVYLYQPDPEQVREDMKRDRVKGPLGQLLAFTGGAADFLTFGLSDEIAAGLDTVVPLNGGRTGWQYGFDDAYQYNLARERGAMDADQENFPVTRMAGQLGGGLMVAPKAAAQVGIQGVGRGVNALRGTGMGVSMARGAGAGAAYGGAYGFGSGEGGVSERVPNALQGAGYGAAGGTAAPLVARYAIQPGVNALQSVNRFAGRQVGRAGEALGVPGAERLTERATPGVREGIEQFGARSRQDPARMASEAERFRAEGIQPVFADVMNDGGRGLTRALATRQTPARQSAREFAEGRAVGLQDRVSTQARRTISDDPRPPQQIRDDIMSKRKTEADAAFGAVRGEMVTPERQVIEALRAPATRTAIEEAATVALNRGDGETANLLRQLTPEALDNPNGVQITVGMADRISRALNGRAETAARAGNNDQASALFGLAERLRGTARQQVRGYDDALTSYASKSRLEEATRIGEGFMNMEADEFAAAVARMAPEERQIARAAARRAVERSAGTQGQAPGAARRLSGGAEQGRRNAALLDDPQPMQRAMRTELQAVDNARMINPTAGSDTFRNSEDGFAAAGRAMDVARRPITAVVGELVNKVRNRYDFSDDMAEQVVELAIDPERTDEAIAMLSEAMTRREARNLVRAMRYQAGITAQSGQPN